MFSRHCNLGLLRLQSLKAPFQRGHGDTAMSARRWGGLVCLLCLGLESGLALEAGGYGGYVRPLLQTPLLTIPGPCK